MTHKNFTLSLLTLSLLSAFSTYSIAENLSATDNLTSTDVEGTSKEIYTVDTVYVTAERMLKQSLGASTVTSEDLSKLPVRNDISELVSQMPGVNLTGNSASGARGNHRQIDIRGMGPENTLIMIDGRPVTSRNSVRYSWRGERDTRGDSNWVPAEAIESIEVMRGVSAARYGSGAMGGVVNIITKKVTDEFHGWANAYGSFSEDSLEGDSYRTGFGLSGPIVPGKLGFRLYGNYNETEADDPKLNAGHDWEYIVQKPGKEPMKKYKHAAGREGVKNTDIGARLAWQLTDAQTLTLDTSWSRQANIYAGDTQSNNPMTLPTELAEKEEETNRMTRQSVALTHEGIWSWGNSKVILGYDDTLNERYPEGLYGGVEGAITKTDEGYIESKLKSLRLSGELEIPIQWGVEHVFTVGVEATHDSLDDPGSYDLEAPNSPIFANRNFDKSEQENYAFYIEDSFTVGDVNIVPTLRFDHNSDSGNNLSPGISAFWDISDNWHLKGGIARAYKAPNLYQQNPNYLLKSGGNGCPVNCKGGCYLMGNEDLDPETSLNKEIGIEYTKGGLMGSLTFFRNDYKNKIIAGEEKIATYGDDGWILQWVNAEKAVVQGLEGSLTVPLYETLTWTTNVTYMDKFEDKTTGNPLSYIPEYTVNSMLNWTPTDRWDVNLTFTQYGKREAKKVASNTNLQVGSRQSMDDYSITSINASYRLYKDTSLRLGVYNVFDKQLLRDGNPESAQTFNQPGRSYYVQLNVAF